MNEAIIDKIRTILADHANEDQTYGQLKEILGEIGTVLIHAYDGDLTETRLEVFGIKTVTTRPAP